MVNYKGFVNTILSESDRLGPKRFKQILEHQEKVRKASRVLKEGDIVRFGETFATVTLIGHGVAEVQMMDGIKTIVETSLVERIDE